MVNPELKIPRHIAIIMDGNGRWAQSQGKERLHGHSHGVDSVRAVVHTATDLGVEFLTIYAFSTENWGRPTGEVDGLMELLSYTIMNELEPLTASGVKMHFIGDTNAMPQSLQDSIKAARERTPDQIKFNLVIALNYSSRWEITRAVSHIAKQVAAGKIKTEEITQDTITQNLTTYNIPDPDLLIRTSGEQRLSNFLLWQLSYTELYFTTTLWPDFGADALVAAIEEYSRRDRRFGTVTNS